MLLIANLTLPTGMAIVMGLAMLSTATFIFFYHDRKHEDLDQWVDYGFSKETLKQALIYYRFVAISMVVFYVLFVINLLLFQSQGGVQLFASGTEGVIATCFFAIDLVWRGAFFDVMEHFDWHLTPLRMNREVFWFVIYCFVFRMFYALVLLRIVISFVWIWTKIRMVRKEQVARRSDRSALLDVDDV